jgi:hypothetical protein
VTLAAVAWVLLMIFSIRQVRSANQASVYIASGRLDLAEEQLKSALNAFSLYKTGKLLVCHNLAVVSHGRKNYGAAAELCAGVLSLSSGLSRHVSRLCRILLADCRLFLGDSSAAHKVLEPLAGPDLDLPLSERLMLLPVELRCRIAEGDFEGAASSLPKKVRLAELLESPKAALVHALLARACRRVGELTAAAFLQRRAELYHDLESLGGEYPILNDSPAEGTSADNNIENEA